LAADRHEIAAGAPRHREFRTIALTIMPGIGPSEERPFFDRLCPAVTENGMIINGWPGWAAID
jgi:hypothetical protein